MALTTVSGKVAEVKTGVYGAGIQIIETVSAGDRTFDRKWMAWFKEVPNVKQGDDITVSGGLLVKLSRDKDTKALKTYVDRTTGEAIPYQDYSLNDCAIDTTW